jgi:hypothetical protein
VQAEWNNPNEDYSDMNDKQVAEKAETLSAPAESGASDALAAELNNMSKRDRTAMAKEFDE